MASDGLWDMLSNEEVAEIVSPLHSKGEEPGAVVERLMEEAHSRWVNTKANADDITVVLAFVNCPFA